MINFKNILGKELLMNTSHTINPDLDFILELKRNGATSFNQCFQCATCSIVCDLSPTKQPFPRKEMIWARWGLKDRLLGNPDIWLCYNCGDCSTLCPRGAKPGEMLAAARKLAIGRYSGSAFLHRLYDDPKFIPLQLIIPTTIILIIGWLTGLLDLRPVGTPIVYANHFPVLLIELIYIPLTVLAGLVFFRGIKNLLADMNDQYGNRHLSDGSPMTWQDFLKNLMGVLPTVFNHKDLGSCATSHSRQKSHMLVSFSFIGLAGVAGAFVFALFVLNLHGPYPQSNPIKIFANIAGLALIAGCFMMIKERIGHNTTKTSYFDWYLLALIFLLGLTGMLSQFIRLASWQYGAIGIYFFHLILAFNLVASLPYSKLAHFVYRTAALAYCKHVGRVG